ncbi:hypothetical protein E2C01_022320 [Portunus trituberculatus]|uniref:Uncharacterized protein n=1 Tax=Portunus trituberculatus TaxID=210409 RepID=A0A5B7E516_PORTR|nr:hypothetical protein [Portunus trituberculatus]
MASRFEGRGGSGWRREHSAARVGSVGGTHLTPSRQHARRLGCEAEVCEVREGKTEKEQDWFSRREEVVRRSCFRPDGWMDE